MKQKKPPCIRISRKSESHFFDFETSVKGRTLRGSAFTEDPEVAMKVAKKVHLRLDAGVVTRDDDVRRLVWQVEDEVAHRRAIARSEVQKPLALAPTPPAPRGVLKPGQYHHGVRAPLDFRPYSTRRAWVESKRRIIELHGPEAVARRACAATDCPNLFERRPTENWTNYSIRKTCRPECRAKLAGQTRRIQREKEDAQEWAARQDPPQIEDPGQEAPLEPQAAPQATGGEAEVGSLSGPAPTPTRASRSEADDPPLRFMLEQALARNEILAEALGDAKASGRLLAQALEARSTSRPRRGILSWLKGLLWPGR